MSKWEYAILTEVWVTEPMTTRFDVQIPDGSPIPDLRGKTLGEVLSMMGNDGWEAVNLDAETVENGSITKYLFKRPKE